MITALYEDELAKGVKNYGPHQLLLACVADRTGVDEWSLGKRVIAVPKKGDSKLRAALREDGALIAQRGPIVVMFDDDRVRDCYGIEARACKREVLTAISKEATGSPHVVLLVRNMEDVINAACSALALPIPAKKPRPDERDRILHRAAAADRRVRDVILQVVPSFERLVVVVDGLLTVSDVLDR